MDETLELALTFAVSAGIGLLVGIERERNPTAKAGVRTFTLIAVLGSGCALLVQQIESEWLLPVGFAVIGMMLAGAYRVDPRTATADAGTTTVVAALLVYVLGALNFLGERTLAVALGIGMTALLYFKTELEGAVTRLTAVDIRSMLQFGAVSAVVLPLLPNRAYGPYSVLNPFHIWTMVVLISGVSLAGYVAWRLTARRGLLLTGLLGGVVSSTATTMVYARHVRSAAHSAASALVVILLANGAMLVRVMLLVLVVAPAVLPRVALVLMPALLLAVPAVWRNWRRAGAEPADATEKLQNPTQLGGAVMFAAVYALILLAAAWLSDAVGTGGLYGLAFLSGLSDVDAITLSSVRLVGQGSVGAAAAATAIGVAIAANLLFKGAVAMVVGGRALGRETLLAYSGPLLGIVLGLFALHALAES